MSDILMKLAGRLIVSCQPVPGGALDRPAIVAAFAQAALAGGAAGLRIEGLANLAAVRAVTDVPVIGLIKVDRDDTPVRITPLVAHVEGLIDAGADIVAVDATDRRRPVPLADLLAAIHRGGALAMADCSTEADGRAAKAMGFDILGSTMAGYTGDTADAADAIRAGADAVVAGSAITRPEHVTDWFAQAIAGALRDRR